MPERVVCDTAKVRFFKQITTKRGCAPGWCRLFAILQKYDFSSKSQRRRAGGTPPYGCLRYCKSTIFQANHNWNRNRGVRLSVVCDTAKVRFFKQITTHIRQFKHSHCCLRYCKSTIFQANHNTFQMIYKKLQLFAILQKYDFSSKSQPYLQPNFYTSGCLRYCKSTIFQANHNRITSVG